MTATHPITVACVPELYPAITNAVVQLQKDVWGAESSELLSSRRLVAAVRRGSELLVAYTEGALVGFALCSPGIEKRETHLHVDLLGVHPDHRNAGVGELLMRELVRIAPLRGIGRIRWTFDPLDGAHANLSLAKIGARGIRFLRNLYGSIARAEQDPERTDRLLAELTVAPDGSTLRERSTAPDVVLEPGTKWPSRSRCGSRWPCPGTTPRCASPIPSKRCA